MWYWHLVVASLAFACASVHRLQTPQQMLLYYLSQVTAERNERIELSSQAWKASVITIIRIPLLILTFQQTQYYKCDKYSSHFQIFLKLFLRFFFVPKVGFEPTTIQPLRMRCHFPITHYLDNI
jgi:hypothetical protein